MALSQERFIDLLYRIPTSHSGDEAAALILQNGGSEEQAQEARECAQCQAYNDDK